MKGRGVVDGRDGGAGGVAVPLAVVVEEEGEESLGTGAATMGRGSGGAK